MGWNLHEIVQGFKFLEAKIVGHCEIALIRIKKRSHHRSSPIPPPMLAASASLSS
jgi:hypothetical protein